MDNPTPKNEPVRLITQTPVGNEIEITLKRWFQTREFWLNLAGWAATVIPIALTLIGGIGLQPIALMIWVLVLQSLLFGANQYIKNTSKSLVVGKHELANNNAASDVIDANGPLDGSSTTEFVDK